MRFAWAQSLLPSRRAKSPRMPQGWVHRAIRENIAVPRVCVRGSPNVTVEGLDARVAWHYVDCQGPTATGSKKGRTIPGSVRLPAVSRFTCSMRSEAPCTVHRR